MHQKTTLSPKLLSCRSPRKPVLSIPQCKINLIPFVNTSYNTPPQTYSCANKLPLIINSLGPLGILFLFSAFIHKPNRKRANDISLLAHPHVWLGGYHSSELHPHLSRWRSHRIIHQQLITGIIWIPTGCQRGSDLADKSTKEMPLTYLDRWRQWLGVVRKVMFVLTGGILALIRNDIWKYLDELRMTST